jgi:hypothetical protein
MKTFMRVATSILLAVGLLWVGDRLLQPVPIPAGSAVVGGLLPLWLDCRKTWVAIGALVGSVLGVGMHAAVHITGGSTLPPEGVPLHVTTDGVRGFVVAVCVLSIVVWILSFVTRVTTLGGNAGGKGPSDS